MSRPIKFRAWDKAASEMLDYCIFGVGSYLYSFEEEGFADWDRYIKKYDVMQFTGLKDRNGVEIYEGDIVRVTSDSKPMFVVYEAPQFVSKWKTASGNTSTAWSELTYSLEHNKPVYFGEVIGNIYESPNLLNESRDE